MGGRRPKAVFFTHLSYRDRDVLGNIGLQPWVEAKWGPVLDRFAACSNVKLVYLFFSNTYMAYLRNAPGAIEAADEDRLRGAISAYLRRKKLRRIFVAVGMQELRDVLPQLESLSINSGGTLNGLFLGQGRELLYDCPKVVEALIRIARRNSDPSPIFRIDEDVKVDGDSIQKLLDEFEERHRQWKRYFFFSGNYIYHTKKSESEARLLNDYSIRVHFLSHYRSKDLLDHLQGVGATLSDLATDPGRVSGALAPALEEKHRFKLYENQAEAFMDIITANGPDPLNQPISGAGLCISPMAIVQLPPFANVATNIMWIDDALKERLHIGIGDLDPGEAAVPNARFQQDRYPNGVLLSDVLWAYSQYLPRLVLGCLMSSLMSSNRDPQNRAAFSSSFVKYIQSREKPSEQDRRQWADDAIERIAALRKALVEHPLAKEKGWRCLVEFAERELDINVKGCRTIVNQIVRNPKLNIGDLCERARLRKNRNAGAYVAEVVSDLQRYVELVDLWPYIIRTIDFIVRSNKPPDWLDPKAPRLL